MNDPHPTDPRSPLSLIELIQARLSDPKAGVGVRHVYGVLDFADARASLQAPCVAVMPLADDFGENMTPDPDEAVVQRDTATIAVISVVSARNDPGGRKRATADRLTPLITATRTALLGWPPEGAFIGRDLVRTDATTRALIGPTDAELRAPAARWHPLMLRRGRLVAIGDGSGRAWWQDEYVTQRLIRGVAPAVDAGATPTELCVRLQGGAPERLEGVA